MYQSSLLERSTLVYGDRLNNAIHTPKPLYSEDVMKKKILIIDDKPAIGQLITLYLSADYDFRFFSNAMDAYNWLKEGNSVDLILSDYTMPEMNGYDLLIMIKQNEFLKNIPVIFLSGEDSSNTRISLLEAGADDFILKPFNPLELKLRIKKALK